MNTETIINVHNLQKSFNNKKIVKGINLHVKKGEIFGFLGPNGSGKTTTIRMLCGLLTPDAGDGFCLGYNILTESSKIKPYVGYMTQKFSFYTDLSVEENLSFIAGVYDLDNRKQRIAKILDEYNLTSRRKQLTGELSGGWKQRFALAACLLHEPKLLLLDEPTAGVDPLARREFWDKIHSLSEKGVTTLVSTHYMDEAERCTFLAYLAYGELIITGTTQDIIAKTKLKTWEITGDQPIILLQKIKNLPGITQAALFGNKIHACGYNCKKITDNLIKLTQKYKLSWQPIEPTLEDAFISLVKQTHDNFD